MIAAAQILPRRTADQRVRSLYRGCLLGGAAGDALGAPVEFMSESQIKQRFGERGIEEFVPAYGRLGAITDDTQMTLFTAEGILRAQVRGSQRGICYPPSVIARACLRWLHTQGCSHAALEDCLDGWLIQHRELFARRAPGVTCLSALKACGADLKPASNDSKGCGGVMRVAPIGMYFATIARASHEADGDQMREAFDLACAAAALTHGHPTGQLSSGVFAAVVLRLLRGVSLRQSIEEAIVILRDQPHHEETLAAVRDALRLAQAQPRSAEAVRQLGEGWVAEEALSISLYCALTANDFRSGVTLAVNHGGDSDSTGSMVGQLLGAIHGDGAIPASWLEELELRDLIAEMAEDLAAVSEWNLEDMCEESDWYSARYPGW